MIEVLVATHGDFAEGLIHSAKMIAGKQENLHYVSLKEGQDVESFKDDLVGKIKGNMNEEDELIIFVDLMGATPFNTVVQARNEILNSVKSVTVVSGVNLPILLEVLTTCNILSYSEIVSNIHKTGSESINIMELKTK